MSENLELVRSIYTAWEQGNYSSGEWQHRTRQREDRRVHKLRRRGKTSGLEIDQMGTKAASLFNLHRGKVMRIVQYFDRDHAIADLGLEE